jgi:hypothetical protein
VIPITMVFAVSSSIVRPSLAPREDVCGRLRHSLLESGFLRHK